MITEYKIVDSSYGDDVEFRKVFHNVKDVLKCAEQYNLKNYKVMARTVFDWDCLVEFKKGE